MSRDANKKLIEDYVSAWAKQKKDVAQAMCLPTLRFISPQDKFYNADDFFGHCWQYSEGLTDAIVMKSVYDDSGGFAIIEWVGTEGKSFIDAEYFRVQSDKIAEIIVVNNFPEFAGMIR